MPTKTGSTSVFTDVSGARKRTVTVAIRGAVALIGLGIAAVAVSVFGHVTLPGLEAPLHLPGVNSTNPTTKDTHPGTRVSTKGTDQGSPFTAPTTQPGSSAKNSAGTLAGPATPRATPTTRATGKPTAKPTTAAAPTQGTKPTDTPGNSGSTYSGR